MVERFIGRTQFDSYEDFKKNYRVKCPPDFNFATHVVDAWAAEEPEKRASRKSPSFPGGRPPGSWPRASGKGTGSCAC